MLDHANVRDRGALVCICYVVALIIVIHRFGRAFTCDVEILCFSPNSISAPASWDVGTTEPAFHGRIPGDVDSPRGSKSSRMSLMPPIRDLAGRSDSLSSRLDGILKAGVVAQRDHND